MSSGLFQHLHEGLAITDLEHRLLDANPAYWTLMAALLEPPAGPGPRERRPDAGHRRSAAPPDARSPGAADGRGATAPRRPGPDAIP